MNLPKVMERIGVDYGRFASEAVALGYAKAVRRCLACKHTAECRHWLDSPPTRAPGPGIDAFCPNAGFVESIVSEK